MTRCKQRCGCLNSCGPSQLKLHSKSPQRVAPSNEEGLRLRQELLLVHVWYAC